MANPDRSAACPADAGGAQVADARRLLDSRGGARDLPRALEALNAAGVPYVVAGAYAIYEHTGIYRKTKDLDLFFEPTAVVPAAARAARRRLRHAARGSSLAREGDGRRPLRRSDLRDGQRCAPDRRSWMDHSRPGILAAHAGAHRPAGGAHLAPAVHQRAPPSRHVGHPAPDPVRGETLDWERLANARRRSTGRCCCRKS